MHRHGAAGLLGLAVLGLAPAAMAADIPGDRRTKAVIKTGPAGVQGVIDRRGDADWYRVTLKGGQNYAFDADGATCTTLNLRDAGGKVLRSATSTAFDTGADNADAGFEFRSAATRTYLVEFRDASGGFCHPVGYPYRYAGNAQADARGDATTAATIAVGQTIDGRLNWAFDTDYFRTRLERSRSYTVSLDHGPIDLALKDPEGNDVFPFRGNTSGSGIEVPATGIYYVAVRGLDEVGGPYTLRLTSP